MKRRPACALIRLDTKGHMRVMAGELLALFVRHGEDAVPAGRRLVEEILLAAFPVGARGPVVRPIFQHLLEHRLGIRPASTSIKSARLCEFCKSRLDAGGAIC